MKSNGYVMHMVDGELKYEHRIVWENHNGPIPEGMQIDHINRIRDDNRIENLRLVTPQQNHFNRSNVKGFKWDKQRKKWSAYIYFDGKMKNLGRFVCMLDARSAYLRAKLKYHAI
jgi:hypothetical protein